MDIRTALNKLKTDVGSEKWQFLQLLIDEALDALDDCEKSRILPKHKIRELILAPIQVSLESTNKGLNGDALIALEAFIDSGDLYDDTEASDIEKDITFQFIDAIWPCTIFTESTQTTLLKLLLRLCLFPRSRLNVNSMLRIIQICTDTYSKFDYFHVRDKAAVARATLVQAVEAFVTKCNVACDAEGEGLITASKYVFMLTRDDQVSSTDVPESQLQILGVLKCLIDTLLPENITPLNQGSVPIYLEAIATITSLLPVSMINQRAFLNILWQRLCPMLMWFLSNQKEEHNLTSTLNLQPQSPSGFDQRTHGTAGSVAAPDLWPEALKCIYNVVVHLTFLIGPVRELRPMLESLYHKMLLYPPAHHRHEALKILCRVLESPEGILCVAGPLVSIPSLSANQDTPSTTNEPLHKPDYRLTTIILESIHTCSSTKDLRLVSISAKCVNALLGSLSRLLKCGSIPEDVAKVIKSQLNNPTDNNSDGIDCQEVSIESQLPDANLPRTLEVDRWAAHDYMLSLLKVVPRLVDAVSIIEIDEILLEFSSSYCEVRRSSVSGGTLNPLYTDDFAENPQAYDVNGTLLNADAVYAATFATLTLNYRLLQAGFYSTRDKSKIEVMSEASFLESILGAGLLLYVSDTWLSQVYREVRHQDILTSSGLSPRLLHYRGVLDPKGALRGTHLVKLISEFDGIGWVCPKYDAEPPETVTSAAYRCLVSGILHVGWDHIVESLVNAVSLAGMTVDRSLGPSVFFVGRQLVTNYLATSGTPRDCQEECSDSTTTGRSLFRSLLKPLIFQGSGVMKSQNNRDLAETLSGSVNSLRGLAGLSRDLGQTGLQARCSKVFGLLVEYVREATTVTTMAASASRIHSAQALSIDVILSNALEFGCLSSECWVHLVNTCQLVRDLEQAFAMACTGDERLSRQSFGGTDDLPDLIDVFCQTNTKNSTGGVGVLLTAEQTGIVLANLSARVDSIFDRAAECLSLPTMLDFLCCLLHASGTELAVRGQSNPTPDIQTEGFRASSLNYAAENVREGILRVTKLGGSTRKQATNYEARKSSDIFLSRLRQVLLRAIKSRKRPLLYLLRAWILVSQHLVDACCFSPPLTSSSVPSDFDGQLVSCIALDSLQECISAFVTSRSELPYFSSNEMFCKPFEILLRLEMCDGNLQDRVISCISEVVGKTSSSLHSGWRPIFAALRSINVTLLIELDSRGPTVLSPAASIGKVGLEDDDIAGSMHFSSRRADQRRVTKVLEMFEPAFHSIYRGMAIAECNQPLGGAGESEASAKLPTGRASQMPLLEVFLSAEDMLVFCNIAVDCVRCLLGYLSAPELEYRRIAEEAGLIQRGNDASSGRRLKEEEEEEASCALCKSTLPLLARCCDIYQFIWAARTSSVDYVLRSAKRQTHLTGPPQFNLLYSVRSFCSPNLHTRIKNFAPWFSTARVLAPGFQAPQQVDPELWTLRSLDEIDQPSGVLHLWFLTLAGMVNASWECHPRVHRDVFEAFASLLGDCVEQMGGQANLCVTRIRDGVEPEEVVVESVAVGASFAVFVVNHALLPRLQTMITGIVSIVSKGAGFNNNEDTDVNPKRREIAEKSPIRNGEHNRDEEEEEASDVAKLCFSIGQTTQLVCSLISRVQRGDWGESTSVVGISLMLHQCLRVLVDGSSLQNARISRLSISCLRHLLISIAPYLTASQWKIAIAHLEEAFRTNLLPIHMLTTVYAESSIRMLSSDAGIQLGNLQPISGEDELCQLAMRLFQLPNQVGCPKDVGDHGDNVDDDEEEKRSYSFEFRIFPLCTHELDRPPVDVVCLKSILTALLNTRLLICLIAELLLATGEDDVLQKLIAMDTCSHAHAESKSPYSCPSSSKHLSTEDFLKLVPLAYCVRLLNCLAECYTSFFDFDQCDDLKKVIQKLLNLPAPANMYQHAHLSAKILQVILLQASQHELSSVFLTSLSQSIKAAFTDFDANINKLRPSNFRCLPLQNPLTKAVGAFLSPLPWLKPLIPNVESGSGVEQLVVMFAGISTHLAQFYIFLLHTRNKNASELESSPFRRSQSVSGLPNFTPRATLKLSDVDSPKKGAWLPNLLGNNRRPTTGALEIVSALDRKQKVSYEISIGDSAARVASLSETLCPVLQGFLLVPSSGLECVFTATMARVVAVAEHPGLRQALAAWFLHLVQKDART